MAEGVNFRCSPRSTPTTASAPRSSSDGYGYEATGNHQNVFLSPSRSADQRLSPVCSQQAKCSFFRGQRRGEARLLARLGLRPARSSNTQRRREGGAGTGRSTHPCAEHLVHGACRARAGECVRLRERESADGQVVFRNSGTEANEAAIWRWPGPVGRRGVRQGDRRARQLPWPDVRLPEARRDSRRIITGFEPMLPFPGTLRPGRSGCIQEARSTARRRRSWLKLIQGEGGRQPAARRASSRTANAGRQRYGLMLIFDEVQIPVRMGCTGSWYAFQECGASFLMRSVATGVRAGGAAAGAFGAWGRSPVVLVLGTHAATFGGNPDRLRLRLGRRSRRSRRTATAWGHALADGFAQQARCCANDAR